MIYITEIVSNGDRTASADIHADSFEEADEIAERIGVRVVGILRGRVTIPEGATPDERRRLVEECWADALSGSN